MARFRFCLIGTSQPLDVDMETPDIDALVEEASRVRFLQGHMTEADEQGVYAGVMIPTGRIQCVFETS